LGGVASHRGVGGEFGTNSDSSSILTIAIGIIIIVIVITATVVFATIGTTVISKVTDIGGKGRAPQAGSILAQ